MSFNLYFAGGDRGADKHLQLIGANRLFSQSNEWKSIQDWTSKGYNNLFIDSGAFSVAHKGINVDIDSYISRINDNPQIPIWAELDVIPYPELNARVAKYTSEKSWENYLYMKERVTSPCYLLPLYHFGEPKEGLKRILNTEVNGKLPEYIGIGGRHGVSSDLQKQYFTEIFSIIQSSKNPHVKVHAFGITVLDILENFPFYSADSTSWLKHAVFGTIVTSFGPICISNKSEVKQINFKWFLKDVQDKIVDEIESKGYTLEELQDNKDARLRFNADFYFNWAQNYNYKGPDRFVSRRLF